MNRAPAEPADAPSRHAPSLPFVWLLDGFNVLHTSMFGNRERSEWWAEEHRERLIARVCGFTRHAQEIWIAFDGDREAEPDARELRTAAGVPVYLVFAPSADDWLVKRVRSYSEAQLAAPAPSAEPPDPPELGGGVAVVTRDRRVAGRSRHAGAAVVTPAEFLDLCAEP